jgi:WD40 repeat protein
VRSVYALGNGRIFSGSYDNTLRVWDSVTGACLRVLEGYKDDLFGDNLCVSALGNERIVSWSYDKALRVWDPATGACLSLEGHKESVNSACTLSDGCIVSGSYDKTLRVWDSATGACLRVLEGHTSGVESVCALEDGRIVSGSGDNTLRVWDSATGACLRVLEGHTSDVNNVWALRNGHILSGSWDETLRVWDSSTSACLEVTPRNSPRAAEIVSSIPPRTYLPISCGRTRAHCTLGGAAPLHLGSNINCNALLTLPSGVRVVVAGTVAGGPHFLELREPGMQAP